MPQHHLKRRAQIQIGESMIVIVMVMIIGVIAFVFAFNKATYEMRVNVDKYQQLDALETAQIAENLDELRCMHEGANDACFDIYKIQAFSDLFNDSTLFANVDEHQAFIDYYYSLFYDARISIDRVFPAPADPADGHYLLYDHPPGEDDYDLIPINLPITLYDAADGTYAFATMRVERYSSRVIA